jgi:ABC-type phosphate/phosphonate transport system substrate-binding protein
MPVVNARMYAVTAECKADWHRVLAWAIARADLDWTIVDHDPPAPLSALWSRDDLGAAFMCGLPFARRAPRPVLVAAPIPRPPRYGGAPVYCTDVAVAVASPHQRLEDTFGGVVGFTGADSMSGAVALRDHLLPFRAARGARLYRGAVGGLVNAQGVIDALAEGRIDVGPLDSYSHDLIRAYDPARAARVRVVASTALRPIPPLVATAAVAADALARLSDALVVAARAARELAAAMARLQLAGFAVPNGADYDALCAVADRSTLPFEEL